MILKKFFDPDSIAIIGASDNSKKLGYTILSNIIEYGYRGKIYPVNPKYKKILTRRCYPSVLEIKGNVDTAVIVIPSNFVPAVLEECGKKKVKNAIIITAGFSEIGPAGKILDQKIIDIVKKYNINILGPNCLGVLDSISKMNASFAVGMISRGQTALISQSGAICTAILDWSLVSRLGFSRFVSLGNKLALDEVDFINYFINDQETKVVMGYFEGITRGKEFIETAKKLTVKKPLIVIKAGRSQAGQKAVSSHTGTLAGDDKVIQAAFDKANVIRADSLQEFFDLSLLFSWQPTLKGNQIALVTNAGGPSVITTDFIAESSLQLAQFTQETTQKLKSGLPSTANIHNPVDLIGDADAARYQYGLNAVLGDKNVNAVIVLLTPQTVTEINKTAKIISNLCRRYKKPVIACFLGGKRVASGIKILTDEKIPTVTYPCHAVKAFEKMHLYYKNLQKNNAGGLEYKRVCLDLKKYENFSKMMEKAKTDKVKMLDDLTAESLLKCYDLPVVKSVLITETREIDDKLKNLEYPLAAKISSPNILHRTDIGGVKVNIKNMEEAKIAFREITSNIKKNLSNELIKGVIFQPMLENRQEIILGAKQNSGFGPLIMFGLGGIFVEIFKDVAFRLAPVSQTDALEMIKQIKAYKILAGARGRPPYDVKAIAANINRLSQLMTDFPQIKEIDINPAMVASADGGLSIVDFKILI